MQRLRRHCLPGLLPSGQVFMRGDIMDALTCVELGKEMLKGFQAGLAGTSEKCKRIREEYKKGGTDESTHDDDR